MPESSDPSLARLRAGSVSLHTLNPGHIPALREIETSEYLCLRWRHHGAHPIPREYEESLWSASLCNFLVQSGARTVGLVSAYDPDFANQHCKVAAAKFAADDALATITGTFLLINYCFQAWPFRKVYFELPAYNRGQIARACGDVLEEEGRLRGHVFLAGEFHDVFVYATYRERWLAYSSRWLDRTGRRSVVAQTL